MKLTSRKFKNFGKLKSMLAGGFGKRGPYIYAGVKHKSGLSVGASIGKEGRNIYGSVNKKIGQARLKHNIETKKTSARLRPSKKLRRLPKF